MTQQTAVEWFAKEAAKLLFDLKKNNDTFQLELCLYGLNQLEEQAKQMFEEQIIDAYENGVGDENERNLSGQFTNAEQYYTKTYGNNQNK